MFCPNSGSGSSLHVSKYCGKRERSSVIGGLESGEVDPDIFCTNLVTKPKNISTIGIWLT